MTKETELAFANRDRIFSEAHTLMKCALDKIKELGQYGYKFEETADFVYKSAKMDAASLPPPPKGEGIREAI